MRETSTADLRWLLPLCQLQNDLVAGNSVADVAELSALSLFWLHQATAVAVWLWGAEPPILLLVANLGNGQREPVVGALQQALLKAGQALGAQAPLPPACLRQETGAAPARPDDAYTIAPLRLAQGAVGCVLIAGIRSHRLAPTQLLGHDIVLDGLASVLQREQRLQDVSVQAANALAQAVDAKDHYTHYHSRSVSSLAEIIARRLGLRPEVVRRTKLAGLLHDLGKIGIPDAILNKPAPLTLLETLQMRQHPVMGQRIVETIEDLRGVGDIVRAHHERWDGKGYPDGRKGTEIPLPARIISVVDAYDAMISDRIYRPGRPIEAAADELLRQRGTQFDPAVVDALVASVHERAAAMRAEQQQQARAA